jgi:hypothetical protein
MSRFVCSSVGKRMTAEARPSPLTWTAEPGPPEPQIQEDVAAVLALHLGEGPGPDDGLVPQNGSDPCAEEKLARLRRYHADVVNGRPIRFLDCDLLLSKSGRLAFLREGLRSDSLERTLAGPGSTEEATGGPRSGPDAERPLESEARASGGTDRSAGAATDRARSDEPDTGGTGARTAGGSAPWEGPGNRDFGGIGRKSATKPKTAL